jgi:hypothetical protein
MNNKKLLQKKLRKEEKLGNYKKAKWKNSKNIVL